MDPPDGRHRHHGGKALGSIAFGYDVSHGGSIKLWDILTRKNTKTITIPPLTYENPVQPALGGAISPDGKWAAVGQHLREKVGKKGDGFRSESAFTIELYDLTTGKKTRSIAVDRIYSSGQLKFSPNSKVLALADRGLYDGSTRKKSLVIKFWNAAEGKHLGTLTGHTNVINSIAFSADGEKLASASNDGTVGVWDLTAGEPIKTFEEKQWTSGVAFGPDGKTLAYGTADKIVGKKDENYAFLDKWQTVVKFVDLDTGNVVQTLANSVTNRITSMAFHKDGKILAVADYGAHDTAGKIKLWNVVTGKELITLGLHEGSVLSVQFSPDGKTMASAGGARDVPLDLEQGTFRIIRATRPSSCGASPNCRTRSPS